MKYIRAYINICAKVEKRTLNYDWKNKDVIYDQQHKDY